LANTYHVIEGQRFCLQRPEFKDVVQSSTWVTRGWTLQEATCSTRLLYFASERTYFCCRTGKRNEDYPNDKSEASEAVEFFTDEDDPMRFGFNRDHSGSRAYLSTVKKMSVRSFTHGSDVLKAWTGIYSVYCLHKLGLSISGLPARYFEAALLWQPAGELTRRPSTSSECVLPSWSWAGWTGPICYPFGEVCAVLLRPTVTWYLYVRPWHGNVGGRFVFCTPGVGRGDMLSGVDYLDPVAESTVWSQTPPNPALPDLPRRDELLQQDDADLSDQMRSLSLEYPSLTETTFVQCRTMIHTFPIRSIKSPEQLSPSVFSFAVDTEPRRFVGEVKADIGTLVSYFSEEPPSTAELVRIADLDFSTQ
jgi:hypothetical protein